MIKKYHFIFSQFPTEFDPPHQMQLEEKDNSKFCHKN